jgi:hypothetical protein
MKFLLAICLTIATTTVLADNKPAPVTPGASVVQGEVVEVVGAGSYTYLRLKTKEGETWAAVASAGVKKGAKVTIENTTVMNNFESKTLKKTFDTLVFGTLGGAAGSTQVSGNGVPAVQTAPANVAAAAVDERVPRATGANAHTVAEIVSNAVRLKDKPVLVSGKVVKYNPGIMGKNWVHLRDGSGSANEGSNDVLLTTMNQVKVGDVVTMKGVVRIDTDLGSGYFYKVMVDEATLRP